MNTFAQREIGLIDKPPEQSQMELSGHLLHEGKVLGFSFSLNCRKTKTHIKSLYFNDNIS